MRMLMIGRAFGPWDLADVNASSGFSSLMHLVRGCHAWASLPFFPRLPNLCIGFIVAVF